MQQLKWRSRIAALVIDAQPTVIVSGMQDESEAIVNLRDELVGFGGDDCEGLEVSTIRPLPCVPDAGEGERLLG
jgi:hypothetical protein